MFPLVLLVVLLALALPLKDTRPSSPNALYDRALGLFQRGFLAESQKETQYFLSRPASLHSVFVKKFQLLEAESMLWRGLYEDTLRVLASFDERSESNSLLVKKLTIEAVALKREQQSYEADKRLIEAESICSTADFPACGDALAARAIVSAKDGQLEISQTYFRRALEFAKEHRDPWLEVSTTLNFGYLAMQADHYDEAVEWSKKAYENALAFRYSNFAQIAAGNLGWAYYQLGDYERALEQFRSAEKIAADLGNPRSQLKWLSDAGYIYRDSGNLAKATQSYRRAYELALKIHSREDTVNALEDLADISVMSGDLSAATSYIDQVTPMEGQGGSRPSSILLLTEGKLAVERNQYAEAEKTFRSVMNDSASLQATKLVAASELADLFARRGQNAAAERMYQVTLDTYDTARAQLKSEESRLPFGTNAAPIYDSYIHFLVQQGKSEAALSAADESRARALESRLNQSGDLKKTRLTSGDPRAVARSVNASLFFYWLGDNESYLWAITPAKVSLIKLPARKQITDRIESYRKTLLDVRDPLATKNDDGQALYRMLVAPAADLVGHNKRLILLTDGELSKLNFETLLIPDPKTSAAKPDTPTGSLHYLIDDYTISSAPSLAMLAAARPAPKTTDRMLLLGNPVSPDRDFPSLPMFGFEMSRVGSHFASKQVFDGTAATPAAYVASQPEKYTYIHFVSHAIASSTTPLDSAIILSKSGNQEGTYKLYAREIIQHPIQAKLVTISACYGTGTRAYAGEGLVGLSWAFLRAGAHKVIGALWEVSDESTPRLMDAMYQGLSDGQQPAEALHNAKLALVHSKMRFRVPFYWAPFQIYGTR